MLLQRFDLIFLENFTVFFQLQDRRKYWKLSCKFECYVYSWEKFPLDILFHPLIKFVCQFEQNNWHYYSTPLIAHPVIYFKEIHGVKTAAHEQGQETGASKPRSLRTIKLYGVNTLVEWNYYYKSPPTGKNQEDIYWKKLIHFLN